MLIFIQRSLQALCGLITTLLVATYLRADEQGWYYAFASLSAIYILFEMGLSITLVQCSGIYFNKYLVSNNVNNNKNNNEFTSYIKWSLLEYQRIGFMYALAMIIFGIVFFQIKDGNLVISNWHFAWVTLVIMTAFIVIINSILFIFEGLGLINFVYSIRLLQCIGGSLGSWVLILSNHYLWAAVAYQFISLIIICLCLSKYKLLIMNSFFYNNKNDIANWNDKINPIASKIRYSALSYYLMSQLGTPILFFFKDATVAGQFGLSLTVFHMIGHLSQVPIANAIPKLSNYFANKLLKENIYLFIRGLIILFFSYFFCIFILFTIYYNYISDNIIQKLLPEEDLIYLTFFVFLYLISTSLASHLRSFNIEPLLIINTIGAFLIVIGSIIMAPLEDSLGVLKVMLYTQLFIVFPYSLICWLYLLKLYSTKKSSTNLK